MRYLLLIACGWLMAGIAVAQPVTTCNVAKKMTWQQGLLAVEAPTVMDLHTVSLDLTIDPQQQDIAGQATYRATALTDLVELPVELSTQLTVSQAQVNGQPVPFRQEAPYALRLTCPTPIMEGEAFTFQLTYAGTPGSGGFGSVGQATVEGYPLWWTLSQPYGTRDWWPVTERLQDKIDTTTITINTPDQYRGIANGLPISEIAEFGRRSITYRHTYPISPYLIAVAVAPYHLVADTLLLRAGTLPVNNYVLPHEVDGVREALDRFNRAFVFLDSLFTPYPFMQEQYGHARFGWPGGMEHQTISFVGSYNYELLVHELAHQWFGDWVTCGSWQDLWLNEGFATYLSGLAYERFYKEKYWGQFLQVREDRILEQPGGSVFRRDTAAVESLFDVRLTYFKAAWVLHQLRWVIGDAAFFAGCRGYLNDPALQGGYATTGDLQYHMEQASGVDLGEFFSDWVYGEGYPHYRVEWSQKGNQVQLALVQTTSHPSVGLYEMPVPLTLVSANSDTTVVIDQQQPVQNTTVLWDQPVEQIHFDTDNWLLGKSAVVAIPADELPFIVIPINEGLFQVAPRRSDIPLTELKVYATNGQLVWSSQSPAFLTTVDLSRQSEGVYILEGRTATQRWTQRLLR